MPPTRREMSSAAEQWCDVEVFRVATGRLPTQPDDVLTEQMCQRVLDMAILEGNREAQAVLTYAAHRWFLFRHPDHRCNEKCRTPPHGSA